MSGNFLSIEELPHEIGMYDDSHNSENLTENPMQDNEGETPTNSASPSVGTSSHERQFKILKAMAELVLQQDFYRDSNMFKMASQSFSEGQTKANLFHDIYLDLQECMRDLLAWEFLKAVMKEVEAHIKDNHQELIKQSEVLLGMDVFPFIWATHCKWNITSNNIKGHEARLNIHGSKQVYGMNYYKIYAPVVMWFAIWFMITLAIMLTL